MTVTYTAEVATCSKFGSFIKLLWRWRGSIYKMVWRDLLLFLVLYYSLHLVYRYGLSDEAQNTFESIVHYCATYSSLIPLSFVLGFYVLLVMTRWWEQYTMIPWPDSIAVFVSAHVHGHDERGRLMRRTIMRYVCLCLTIVFTMISPCVKKRFPNRKYFVEAGLLLESERIILEAIDAAFPKTPKHWMPIVWACSIITRARYEGRIRDDIAVKAIIDELNIFRGRAGTLTLYDFISIPLVYTQVVTIAVYSFFVCSLLAHQWTKSKPDPFAIYEFSVPLFITMEFFFYMGWLKVAEVLINPWGEDDDDFEVNWMIDRNLQVSFLIVDEMHHEHPELVKDQYWDEVFPAELPYEADAKRGEHPLPSTAKYDVHLSPTQSETENAPSDITVRSESLKWPFHKVSQEYSEEDNDTFIPFDQSSDQLLLDVESVKCITSYMPHDLVQEEPTLVNVPEGGVEKCDMSTKYDGMMTDDNEGGVKLEEQVEEEEVEEEVEEEEVEEEEAEEEEADEEEEWNDYETSSILGKTDSDFDPFETLREQRQRERIQRTTAILKRYFGTNFKIVSSTSIDVSDYGSQITLRSNVERPAIVRLDASSQTHATAFKIALLTPSSLHDLDNVASEISTQANVLCDASVSPKDSMESAVATAVPSVTSNVNNSPSDRERH